MSLERDDAIVILLGAGASKEAGIPHSSDMINSLESRIFDDDSNWAKYRELYNYIKSSIYFSEGIHGVFHDAVKYNIEKLVDILNEISQRNEHALYPFVGAWNPALVEVAGEQFHLVSKLRDDIVRILRTEWLAIKSYETSASYYGGILRLQNDLNYPLRVFSLNYDLCLERIASYQNTAIERGFDDEDDRKWDWRRFFENEIEVNVYLYKLHGSMDWTYERYRLTYHDDPSAIPEAAIIFGKSYKLEYRDPFFFLANEFSRWTRESRLIVAIGYGFGDAHINTLLREALHDDPRRALLVVAPFDDEDQAVETRRIAKLIDHSYERGQIKLESACASNFMKNRLDIENLRRHLSPDDDTPF